MKRKDVARNLALVSGFMVGLAVIRAYEVLIERGPPTWAYACSTLFVGFVTLILAGVIAGTPKTSTDDLHSKMCRREEER